MWFSSVAGLLCRRPSFPCTRDRKKEQKGGEGGGGSGFAALVYGVRSSSAKNGKASSSPHFALKFLVASLSMMDVLRSS